MINLFILLSHFMITRSDKSTATPYKIIIIGDSCTGKSSLLLKLVDDTFIDKHKVTIGVDFKAKYVLAGNIIVKLKIWDTAGQERFRSIIRTYYNGTNGIVLVFDLTNKESFDNLHEWINEIYETHINTSKIILIGNKCDLVEKREVEQKDIDEFIQYYNSNNPNNLDIKYFECSSKLGTNVNIAFVDLANQMLFADFSNTNKAIEKMELGIASVNNEDITKSTKSYKLLDDHTSCCVIS